MKNTAFQNALIDRMKTRGLSDEDVARIVGCSRPAVTRWRNGVTQPHQAMQKSIISMLDLTMNIKSKSGKEISVAPWADTIAKNVASNRDPFECTPIGVKADKSYFWVEDHDDVIDLDKRSVNQLVKKIRAGTSRRG